MQLVVIMMSMLDLQRLGQAVPQAAEASLFFGRPKYNADRDSDGERGETCSYEMEGRLLCGREVEVL